MFENEVAKGKRFEFGKNWQKFLAVLDSARISQAELSLKQMLEVENLNEKKFLDIGSGSGLFSLAARRLGAQVHSFDFDPQSVACTSELKERYFKGDDSWIIERGSALDTEYVKSLGRFDVVYSWGVLHHTGEMWKALSNAQIPVDRGGVLYISIYDDQGLKSRIWLKIKQLFCSGMPGKTAVIAGFFPFFVLKNFAVDLISLRSPFRRYIDYKRNRGMSIVRDWIDWLGGLPYEFAKPEEILDFYRQKQLLLARLKMGGMVNKGLNEFIFKKCN